MKSIILFLTIVFSVYCCHNPQSGTVSGNGSETYYVALDSINGLCVVPVDSLKAVRMIIPLSRLVEDCSMVQLETKEEAHIGSVYPHTTITEKYIGVARFKDSFLLFNRSGIFLCTVGSPATIHDVIIDDKNELIYLSHLIGNKILVYNTSGQFVKDIVAPQMLMRPLLFLSDSILTVVHAAMNNSSPAHYGYNAADAMVLQFDVNTGELLKKIAPPEHLIIQSLNDGAINTTRNTPGQLDVFLLYHFVKSTYRDTLYHIDVKNNKLFPVFTMTYSSDEIPKSDGKIFRKPIFYQLNKNLILTDFLGKGFIMTDLSSKTSSWCRIVNDFYGNIPVTLNENHNPLFFNGYFVHNIESEELMKMIKKRLSQNDCTKKEKQTLKKTLLTLKKGTNNVVFIGKLKSETNLF